MKHRRLFAAFTAAALVLSLTGCSGDDEELSFGGGTWQLYANPVIIHAEMLKGGIPCSITIIGEKKKK